MPCERWNEVWVGRLYDELEPQEARALDDHLEDCQECRRTLDELSRARELLRGAGPVPAAPRLVVLSSPSRLRHPGWAFASGLAAALLVFASGLYVGSRQPSVEPGEQGDTAARPAAVAGDADARAAGDARWTAVEARLAALERAASGRPSALDETPAGRRGTPPLTRDELDERLGQLERRIRADRAGDVEFLLGEIRATEWRAGHWVDETREALRYVALRGDARLSEQ